MGPCFVPRNWFIAVLHASIYVTNAWFYSAFAVSPPIPSVHLPVSRLCFEETRGCMLNVA